MHSESRRSLWWRTAEPAPQTAELGDDAAVDVAIVGGGFTGLTAALHLARRGARVAVLEAGALGAGASGVNAGFVVPNFAKADPARVVDRLGEERGRALLEVVGRGADRVFQTAAECHIACDAAQTGWLQPAHSAAAAETARRRVEAWQALGRPVAFLGKEETRRLTGVERYRGALLDRSGGTIQPLSYLRGLARAAIDAGAVVCEQTAVRRAEREGARWRLDCGEASVTAETVLVCTNADATGIARRLGRVIVPLAVYQIATEPLPPEVVERISPERMPMSDMRANLFTHRLDRDDRLISGGMAIVPIMAHRRLARAIVARLARELKLPGAPKLEFVWRGTAAMTADFLPHLYELGPGAIGAIGCNGRGVAMTAMLGEALAEAALGRPLAELPVPSAAPRPIPLHALAGVVAAAALAHARWQDWRGAS